MRKGEKKEKPKVDLECGPAQPSLFWYIPSSYAKVWGGGQNFSFGSILKVGQKQHISSRYAKILGKQNFSLSSFPEVGQKQKNQKQLRNWM